jgi:hypothetical protein
LQSVMPSPRGADRAASYCDGEGGKADRPYGTPSPRTVTGSAIVSFKRLFQAILASPRILLLHTELAVAASPDDALRRAAVDGLWPLRRSSRARPGLWALKPAHKGPRAEGTEGILIRSRQPKRRFRFMGSSLTFSPRPSARLESRLFAWGSSLVSRPWAYVIAVTLNGARRSYDGMQTGPWPAFERGRNLYESRFY